MMLANVAFGAASGIDSFTTFTLIWIVNGYMQAFGAPGMVKINAAWFSKAERGTFAGIFGFMIQLGMVSINRLAPALLSGFTLAFWTVPKLHWKCLFWIPPFIALLVLVLVFAFAKETPEEAGFEDVHPSETAHTAEAVRTTLQESFLTIVKHPLVWLYALAYACRRRAARRGPVARCSTSSTP